MRLLRVRFAGNALPAAIGSALFLAACEPPAPRYLAEPQRIDAQGPFLHQPSGLEFPPAIAGFQRISIAHFAASQPDLAVAYALTGTGGPIAATVYLAPAPALFTVGMSPDAVAASRDRACRAGFDQARRDLIERTLARTVSQRNVSVRQGGRSRPGRLAVFAHQGEFAGRRQRLRTELAGFCFASADWSIEYRFTYPETLAAAQRIAGFLQALAWTGRLAD